MTQLSDLTDVSITDPQEGQRLVYEDGVWVNKTVGGGSVPLEWSQEYYDQVYAAGPGSWVRNPSWLAMPAVTDTDQKFVGLMAVYPDSSFAALTASGAYTVDWGDGTAPVNVASGAQANYLYDYNATGLSGSNAPVVLTASTSTVNRTAHGYTNGMPVTLYDVVGTTGVVSGQRYWVVNATGDSFQVAATTGGAPLTLTGDGTAALLPYKQALVTVTPQAGQNLTALNLNVKNSTSGLQTYETGWLDIAVGSPNFSSTGFALAGTSITQNVRFAMCERVWVLNLGGATSLTYRFNGMRELVVVELPSTSLVTNMSSMFNGCSSLQTVPLFNIRTTGSVDMSSMFNGCSSLQTVPLFNTQSVTSMGSMFSSCLSLQTVPLFNTQAVTNMSSMFNGCSSLQTVPLFNTQAVTSMNSMFQSCSSLQTVPLFNTQAVTSMSSMFQSCSSLQTVPLFNIRTTGSVDMSSMFSSCTSLQAVPLFNTQSVTNMSFMFSGCSSLQAVPLFNTGSVTNMSQMFNSCSSLQTVPLFNTQAVTNMALMFNSCSSLQTVPALVTTAVTSSSNFNSMFASCNSLSSIKAKDFRFTFSVANCKLSAAALNEIYTNLPTVTGQTITVTGNYGTAGDDPTIATAKGWTVTG